MLLPIPGCHFVIHWFEDESKWVGMVEIPPREEVLTEQGESPEEALLGIVSLSQYVMILQNGSEGNFKGNQLVEACESLLHNQSEVQTFLGQQEAGHDVVNAMRGILERMDTFTGGIPWYILPPRAESDEPSYIVTPQRVRRRH
jgi:hypothetical protein